jgi:ribose 1,5-bisphosphate isomerase
VPEREAPTVDEAARDIETMEVRGAAKLSRHAVSALGRAAREGGSADELREAARRLLATRPSAVSLRNGLAYAIGGLDEEGPDAVHARAGRYVHDSLRARERVARHGARLIEGADVVLTHCNSQAAVHTIASRHDQAPLEAAIVLETRPWRQGLITARQLVEHDVPVRFTVDAAMRTALDRADAVVTGCDTIARNGDVVNKIGTRLLALAAEEANVPFYVTAESFKLDPSSNTGGDVRIEERDPDEVLEDPIDGVTVHNPVFDVTPAERIRRIATEDDAHEPANVVEVFEDTWGAQLAEGARRLDAGKTDEGPPS